MLRTIRGHFMRIPNSPRERRAPGIEPLEPRIAPAAATLAVARALDLEDGALLTISGDPAAVATLKFGAAGHLLGFPSGGDGDFLVLSTGHAAHLTTLANTGERQGTDLGPVGEDGDSVSVSFTVAVPSSPGSQRFKLDFLFLSDEYPEFVGALTTDDFTIIINGVPCVTVDINHEYFTGAAAPGTYFDGRSEKLTLSYAVPDGVTELQVELRLRDLGDGQVDSAVLVDNARFVAPETVYLDFDGGAVSDLFGPGLEAFIPAFDSADLGSAAAREEIIAQVVAQLRQLYDAYDILFTTTLPESGSFTTVLVGGTNELLLDLSGGHPLLAARFPSGQGSVAEVFALGSETLLGFTDLPDVGNRRANDHAVVFSGEFAAFFSGASEAERVEHLTAILAREIGHTVGWRDVEGSAPIFSDTSLPLAQAWSDGATEQNGHAYLLSVLGGSGGSGLFAAANPATTFFAPRLPQIIYDATVSIGGVTLHFDQLDGTQNLAIPVLPADAKISIFGASVPNGVVDLFTGSPVNGTLNDLTTAVPLFSGGSFTALPLAKRQSGALVAQTPGTLLGNALGHVTLALTKTVKLVDADGDTYTIKLTGPGSFGYTLLDPDLDGRGGLASITLEGTTLAQSSLSISVSKKRGGDGLIEIGEILGIGGAGLKSLSASKASLVDGGAIFSGALGSVTLRDLANGADLIAGAAEGIKTKVTLRAVGDGSELSFGTEVSSLQAARLGDSVLAAPAIGKLTLKGDKRAGLLPDLGAQVQIAGLLGSLAAGDLTETARLLAGGSALDRTKLTMKNVAGGVILSLASTVTSLRAIAIGDAHLDAFQFGTITLTGAFAGDLVSFGKIGRFTGKDVLGTAAITAGGIATDKTSLSFRDVQDGAVFSFEDTISSLSAARIGDVQIAAAAMGKISIKGDRRLGIAGDFRGAITLEGGDSLFKNALSTVSIAGGVFGASIVAESIGSFSANSVANSTLFAGYAPTDPLHPFEGGAFSADGSIKSFTIRSKTAGFSNTVVAGATIGTIKLASADLDNGGTAFGFLAQAAPKRVSIPSFADSDLHVRVVPPP